MNVKDLTGAYLDLYVKGGDLSAYEATDPALFEHYNRYWGMPDRRPVVLDKAQLEQRRKHIIDVLPTIKARFQAATLDLSETELVLMVGQHTSNGHGWLRNGQVVAWLAVEGYPSALMAKVFVTHELIHALHYRDNLDFYFSDRATLCDPMRQLLIEGIATYLTGVILGCDRETALWSDYLGAEQVAAWMTECRGRLSELADECLSSIRSGATTEMFLANESNDVMRFRAGYYLGLVVIEKIVLADGLSPFELLDYPRAKMERRALDLLADPSRLF